MEPLRKSSRLSRYPELLIHCKAEGAFYAACVVNQENVKLNSCAKEFEQFKNCLTKAAISLKTKL